jgi:thiopurine S-methyltransferase
MSEQDGFYRYESDRLELLHGDFFNLTPKHLQDVVAVFDRASLVPYPANFAKST